MFNKFNKHITPWVNCNDKYNKTVWYSINHQKVNKTIKTVLKQYSKTKGKILAGLILPDVSGNSAGEIKKCSLLEQSLDCVSGARVLI